MCPVSEVLQWGDNTNSPQFTCWNCRILVIIALLRFRCGVSIMFFRLRQLIAIVSTCLTRVDLCLLYEAYNAHWHGTKWGPADCTVSGAPYWHGNCCSFCNGQCVSAPLYFIHSEPLEHFAYWHQLRETLSPWMQSGKTAWVKWATVPMPLCKKHSFFVKYPADCTVSGAPYWHGNHCPFCNSCCIAALLYFVYFELLECFSCWHQLRETLSLWMQSGKTAWAKWNGNGPQHLCCFTKNPHST